MDVKAATNRHNLFDYSVADIVKVLKIVETKEAIKPQFVAIQLLYNHREIHKPNNRKTGDNGEITNLHRNI